jgi:hypothetical protein
MLMNDLNYSHMDLCTYEFLQLNKILNKMVFSKLISQEEKEELLHKSGLTKLEDGSWSQYVEDTKIEIILDLSETL